MATKERWVELLRAHRVRHPRSTLESFVLGAVRAAAEGDDLDDIKAILAAYREVVDQQS